MGGTSKIPAKSIFQSWTLWFNALSLLAVLINQFAPLTPVVINDPDLAKNVNDLLLAVLAVVNILLRFKTDRPVSLKSE